MAKKKSTKERRRTSARETAEKNTGFERTAIIPPEGAKQFEPKKAGVYKIDIMPYVVGKGNPNADKGMEHYERTFFVHRNVGPSDSIVICPLKSVGKPCPICEHRSKLDSHDEGDKEIIKSLKWSKRQLFNVRDLNNPDDGPMWWEVSHFCFGKQLDDKIKQADADEEEAFNNFFYPEAGMAVKMGATEESGGDFSFIKFGNIEFKPRKKQYKESIIDESHDLDAMVKVMDYADLKKLFLQQTDVEDDEDEDEDDEDENPKKKKRGKGKEDDDEEEEDIDDEDDADEDEEESEEEDEDEEEEDDDDEEESEFSKGDRVTWSKGSGVITVVKGDKATIKRDAGEGGGYFTVSLSKLTAAEDDEEEEEEDEPKPKKKDKAKAKTKKKSSKEDDDEEEEDDDDDIPFDDDEEEEEEEDDEDEDEPKPKKKKKGKR